MVCVRSLARASRSARLQRARTTAPAGLKRLTSPAKEPEPSSGGRLTDAPAAANLPCALDDGRLQRKSSAWSPYPPLTVADLPEQVLAGGRERRRGGGFDPAGRMLEEVERELIEATLRLTAGNREKAAKLMGIGERTLYLRLEHDHLD